MTVDGGSALCRHVGIYLENDEVIEFRNELRKTTLAAFIEGAQPVYRVHYKSPWQPDELGQIVGRAMGAWKNQEIVGSYDVISNNSEHFVTYCTFGKRLSYEGIKTKTSGNEAELDDSMCYCCSIM